MYFNTEDTELKEHNGTKVKVIRALTEKEANIEEVGRMYKCKFENGEIYDVFEDELT